MNILHFLSPRERINVTIKTSGRNERLRFEPDLKITPQENVNLEFVSLYNYFTRSVSGPIKLDVKYQGFYRGFERRSS